MQNSLLCCDICQLEFKSEAYPNKPVVLNCGHSVCHQCFAQIKTCPTCKVFNTSQLINRHGLKGSVNYTVSQNCNGAKDPGIQKKDLESLKGTFFCFDCGMTFRPVEFSFQKDHHETHDKIALEGRDLSEVSKFLWIHQNKDVSLSSKGSVGDYLRSSLYLIERFMNDIEQLKKSTPANADESLDSLLSAMIRNGPQTSSQKGQSYLDSYTMLKDSQEQLYGRMQQAVGDSGPGEIERVMKLNPSVQSNKAETTSMAALLSIPSVTAAVIDSLVGRLKAAKAVLPGVLGKYVRLNVSPPTIWDSSLEPPALGKRCVTIATRGSSALGFFS